MDYIATKLPTAERVQLLLLKERYCFTEAHLEEIKTHWIKDNNYTDYYNKPGGKYDTAAKNPHDV
tara:strand:- start:1728 stop:1922 length:195 start_codon:yes stop_codon:yes gene_type:complete